MNKKIQKIGIIITPDMFSNKMDGLNINGPCLIKVPNFIKNPIGKYYLYFGHHCGQHIRLAYSDNIEHGYKIFEGGVLNISQIYGYDHLSSPEIIVNHETSEIELYYHCPYKHNKIDPQSTFCARSNDGINFVSDKNMCFPYPYYRQFKHNNNIIGLAMEKIQNESHTVVFYNNKTKKILKMSRHVSMFILNNTIYLLYSTVGNTPEHIQICQLLIHEDNCYTVNESSLFFPTLEYETSGKKPTQSKYGMSNGICELRDPYAYIEDTDIYILYTVGGEKGIAIAKFIT